MENSRSLPAYEPDGDAGIIVPQADKPGNPNDSEAAKKRLARLQEWLDLERQRQAPNRYQQAIDEDFYDNLQWMDDDAAVLLARGQAPLVYNWVQTAVKWVTGTEKRTRIDFKIYPRSDDDRNEAENKTKVMKYLSDVNRSAWARSRAFDDAVKVGVGWLEGGIRGDPTKELIFDRAESWRNILYDSFGFERDASDWRYIFRQKVVDVDIACAVFPDRAHAIKSAAVASDLSEMMDEDEYYLGQLISAPRISTESGMSRHAILDASTAPANRRERVRLYEGWYRYPEKTQFLIGGPLHGIPVDQQDEYHAWLVNQKSSSVIERLAMRMRCAIFIRGTLIADGISPYRHNDFPFTPVWGNRRGRDGMAYGMVRVMRDPQEDFNKRMSKAIHALSTRRVFMDKGAMEDIEEVREEAARPDSVFEVTPGMRFEMDTDTQVAKEHLDFAQLDAKMIQVAGGVTDELMGRKTNAVSGKAIEARQDQGSTVTTDYFDNLRFSTQVHGQKQLSLSEQFMTMRKKIRVIGQRRGYDFITINDPGEDEETGQPTLLNDITRAQADFIVSTQDYRETIRQAQFDTLMTIWAEFAKVSPEFALKTLDDVLEYGDIPGAEDLIASIRDFTGKKPRDKQLSPKEEAQAAAQQQAEAQKQQAAERLSFQQAVLTVGEQAAKIRKLNAEAAEIAAKAETYGADSPLRAEYEKKIKQIQDDTTKLVTSLTDKVREAQAKSSDRTTEIERKYITQLAEARIKADSDQEVAKIKANAEVSREEIAKDAEKDIAASASAADQAANNVRQLIEDLRREMDDSNRKAEAAVKEAKSSADDAQKQAEEAIKAAEKIAKDADTKIAQVQKAQVDSKAQAPQQPMVIVVPSGGSDGPVDVDVATDAQGNVTGVSRGEEVTDFDVKISTDAKGVITGMKGTKTKKRAKKPAAK